MLELLNRLVTAYGEYTKINPVIAGAMSLYVLGTLTYLCRKVPESLWDFMTKELTTTFFINNEERGYNQDHFMGLVKWFNVQKWSKFSRSMTLDLDYMSTDTASMAIGAGNGLHFFFYKHRLFLLRRTSATQQGMSQIIHNIHLTMFGRDKRVMEALIEEFCYKRPARSSRVYRSLKRKTSSFRERMKATEALA